MSDSTAQPDFPPTWFLFISWFLSLFEVIRRKFIWLGSAIFTDLFYCIASLCLFLYLFDIPTPMIISFLFSLRQGSSHYLVIKVTNMFQVSWHVNTIYRRLVHGAYFSVHNCQRLWYIHWGHFVAFHGHHILFRRRSYYRLANHS